MKAQAQPRFYQPTQYQNQQNFPRRYQSNLNNQLRRPNHVSPDRQRQMISYQRLPYTQQQSRNQQQISSRPHLQQVQQYNMQQKENPQQYQSHPQIPKQITSSQQNIVPTQNQSPPRKIYQAQPTGQSPKFLRNFSNPRMNLTAQTPPRTHSYSPQRVRILPNIQNQKQIFPQINTINLSHNNSYENIGPYTAKNPQPQRSISPVVVKPMTTNQDKLENQYLLNEIDILNKVVQNKVMECEQLKEKVNIYQQNYERQIQDSFSQYESDMKSQNNDQTRQSNNQRQLEREIISLQKDIQNLKTSGQQKNEIIEELGQREKKYKEELERFIRQNIKLKEQVEQLVSQQGIDNDHYERTIQNYEKKLAELNNSQDSQLNYQIQELTHHIQQLEHQINERDQQINYWKLYKDQLDEKSKELEDYLQFFQQNQDKYEKQDEILQNIELERDQLQRQLKDLLNNQQHRQQQQPHSEQTQELEAEVRRLKDLLALQVDKTFDWKVKYQELEKSLTENHVPDQDETQLMVAKNKYQQESEYWKNKYELLNDVMKKFQQIDQQTKKN